jgi:asparagine synthase (glutamine-hydrolysing)
VTAIAGAVGGPNAELERWTRTLLAEQISYGKGNPRVEAVEHAAFGIRRSHRGPAPQIFRNLIIVADVRLDDREPLLSRLTADGRATDQEILALAWQTAGEKCLDWLVGDFAFAIFDRNLQTLFLARDPTGQRPLHFAIANQAVAFASMPAAFRAFTGPLRADRLTIAKLAGQVRNTTGTSFFEDVCRVCPGELVKLQLDGQSRRRTYWNPSFEPQHSAGRPELVDEFRHLLDTAVGARIANRALPIACHLSSGFDSSSITATAARLLKSSDRVVAFTAAPRSDVPIFASPGRFGDESMIAAETAAMHAIRHVVVRNGPRVVDVIRSFGPLLQLPLTGATNLVWWLEIRKQAAALGADCLLTGDLGNLSLNLGGLPFLAEWVRRRAWRTLARQLMAGARSGHSRARGLVFSAFAPSLPRIALTGIERLYFEIRPFREVSFLRPEWQAVADHCGEQRARSADPYADVLNAIRGEDPGEFRKAAIASDAVEELDPMSDRRLIEYALKLPPEQLYWNGVNRPLMREALSGRLPAAVFEARGRGMQGADWAARLTRDDAEELLEEMSASSTAQDMFDLDRMRRAVEQWPVTNWSGYAHLQQFLIALIPSLAIGMFLADLDRQRR